MSFGRVDYEVGLLNDARRGVNLPHGTPYPDRGDCLWDELLRNYICSDGFTVDSYPSPESVATGLYIGPLRPQPLFTGPSQRTVAPSLSPSQALAPVVTLGSPASPPLTLSWGTAAVIAAVLWFAFK